ncbi:hypothetical protein [Lactovum odontotermitis]
MTDLDKYSNFYADLAQGAYTGRPVHKMLAKPDDNQLSSLNKNGYAEYNFGGGTKSVYLQPAIKISTHIYTSFPNPNDSYYNPKIFREAAA